MPPPCHAAADASLASLGSLGSMQRHGGHRRNLSAIPELAESGEGGGGAAGAAAFSAPGAAAAAARWRPALGPSHAHAAAPAAPALQPSPELAHPVQLRREQLRRPSPPSVGRSIATQAFYTAASEAPLPLTDENSICCTADSQPLGHAAAAAAGHKASSGAGNAHTHVQRYTTLCGITRQAPGRRQSDMAGDLVRGVGESLLSARHTSRHGTATAAPLPRPAVSTSQAWSQMPAAAGRPAGVPAAPQQRSPGRKRAAAQLSVAASDAPPATKVAAPYSQPPTSRGGSSAAEQVPAAVPPGLTPALASQPSDPNTQPLAAGLGTLPSFSSWRAASDSQGCLAGSGELRRSRSLGSGLDSLGQAASGSGGSSWRDSTYGTAPLAGPVPQHSTEITFMPLGHQGSKWPAGTEPLSAAAPCGAAAVAAVPLLTRSTVAALLGEPLPQQQQSGDARLPSRPAAGALERSLVSEGTDESAGAAATELPAYRPWTAVRRVIEEVGRQAGSGALQDLQQQARQQNRAAPAGCRASCDSTSTVAMPWDRSSVPRSTSGASSAQPKTGGRAGADYTERSMRRPPRPPGSSATHAAAAAGRQAVQPRMRLPPPPLPPPAFEARAWSAGPADDFSPLFRSALSQSQLARQQGTGVQRGAGDCLPSQQRTVEDADSSCGPPAAASGQGGGSRVWAALARLLLGQRRRTASEG